MTNGEKAKGWLSAVMPVLREGGPVSLLIVLGFCVLIGWFMNKQYTRQQETIRETFQMLLSEKDKRLSECYGKRE